MKRNMLLIIGLVFVMMLGVTGTAISGTGDPPYIVKDGPPPTYRGSIKAHTFYNRHTVWFYNADDAQGWYPDTIDELRVWDKKTYQKWVDSRYSDEFKKPLLYKQNIPSGEYVSFSDAFPTYSYYTWCGVSPEKFLCIKRVFSLRIEWSYVDGSTSNRYINVPEYDTVHLYRVDAYE